MAVDPPALATACAPPRPGRWPGCLAPHTLRPPRPPPPTPPPPPRRAQGLPAWTGAFLCTTPASGSCWTAGQTCSSTRPPACTSPRVGAGPPRGEAPKAGCGPRPAGPAVCGAANTQSKWAQAGDPSGCASSSSAGISACGGRHAMPRHAALRCASSGCRAAGRQCAGVLACFLRMRAASSAPCRLPRCSQPTALLCGGHGLRGVVRRVGRQPRQPAGRRQPRG